MYSNSNENMLFLRKTDETIWKPLFQLTPLFMTSLFGQISERRYRGGGGILGWEETMTLV